MKNKISFAIVFIFSIISFSCSKKTDEILAMLEEIKQQNSDLKSQVTNLQKTTDSLSVALKVANQNIASMDKKIDSIRNQLSSMVIQINALSTQLNQANVNILDLQKRIAELQAKCQQLVDLLKLLTGTSGLSDGLIAYYPFSGNAGDSSGNGHHGTVYGATLTSDRFGNSNQAYSFDGVNDYIEAAHTNKFDFTSNKQTISIWIKSNPVVNNQFFISKYSGEGLTTSGFRLEYDINANDVIVYRYRENNTNAWGQQDILLSDIQSINNWYHVVAVADNGIDYLYINGSLVKKTTIPHSIKIGSNTVPFRIGASSNSSANSFCNGLIDDVRIYNRALTQSEISYLATH